MLVFQWLGNAWAFLLPWWPAWAALAAATIITIVIIDKKGE